MGDSIPVFYPGSCFINITKVLQTGSALSHACWLVWASVSVGLGSRHVGQVLYMGIW